MTREGDEALDRRVDELFDRYGAAAILAALAERLRGEAGIALGEDPESNRWHKWAHLADDIDAVAEEAP